MYASLLHHVPLSQLFESQISVGKYSCSHSYATELWHLHELSFRQSASILHVTQDDDRGLGKGYYAEMAEIEFFGEQDGIIREVSEGGED